MITKRELSISAEELMLRYLADAGELPAGKMYIVDARVERGMVMITADFVDDKGVRYDVELDLGDGLVARRVAQSDLLTAEFASSMEAAYAELHHKPEGKITHWRGPIEQTALLLGCSVADLKVHATMDDGITIDGDEAILELVEGASDE